jgi:hypothetical protein
MSNRDAPSRGSVKTLSGKENAGLEDQLRAGNQAARMRLIEGNMPLVTFRVERYIAQKPHLANSWDDLIQQGNMALTQAVDSLARKKKPTGENVLGYLSKAVQRRLGNYIDGETTIVVPDRTQRHRRSKGRAKVGKTIENFFVKHGCEFKPAISELVKGFCDRENVLLLSPDDAPKSANPICDNQSVIGSLWSHIREQGVLTKGRGSSALGLLRQAFDEYKLAMYPTDNPRVDRDAEISSQPTAIDPIALLELQEEIEACCLNEIDLQFVRHAAMGYTDREIGKLLGLHTNTINDRRAAIYDRFLERTGMKRR